MFLFVCFASSWTQRTLFVLSTLLMIPNSLAWIIWQKYARRVIALFQHFSPTTFPVKFNISPRKFSLRANVFFLGQAHGRVAPCKISLGYMSLQKKPSDLLTARKAAPGFEFLEESAQYSSSTVFNPIGAPERPVVCKIRDNTLYRRGRMLPSESTGCRASGALTWLMTRIQREQTANCRCSKYLSVVTFHL